MRICVAFHALMKCIFLASEADGVHDNDTDRGRHDEGKDDEYHGCDQEKAAFRLTGAPVVFSLRRESCFIVLHGLRRGRVRVHGNSFLPQCGQY